MSEHCHKPIGHDPGPRRTAEFFPGATHWPADLSRREFLQLMGASLALAGLTACGRPTQEKIVPYVIPPEMTPSPDVMWYATALPWQGYARGILARSVHGRPVKLEGNPDHPESLGATDAVTQAAILSLYDPDRSAAPRRAGQVATWDLFEREWSGRLPEIKTRRGAGFALLTEPTTSPTELREIGALLEAWPEVQWFQHTALPRFDQDGVQSDFDFAAADVILSVGSDFLFHHPSSLRFARAFSSRRRVENGRANLNRFFAIEPTFTLTGAQADARLAAAPSRMPALLNALARSMDGSEIPASFTVDEREFILSLAAHLAGGRQKKILCIVGEEMPVEFHQWAGVFNRRFGGDTVNHTPALRSDGAPLCRGGLTEMVAAIDAGKISGLCILGTNPVYTAPADVEVTAAIRQVAWTVHLGSHVDETAEHCLWHLPQSHFLETWSDLRAYSGSATLLQPLVEPLNDSRSTGEVVNFLRTGARSGAYDLVRGTWRRDNDNESDFETQWHAWLNRGVVDATRDVRSETASKSSPVERIFPVLTGSDSRGGVTLLVRADASVSDGRWANNAWLQELPRPFTALVWENAALIDAALAKRMELQNGDVIVCEANGRKLEAPVWILPGQAADCVTVALGYGRTHGGETARDRGFSAYRLRTVANLWQQAGVSIRRAGRRQTLVSTQRHFTMEGRDLARMTKETDLSRQPESRNPASLFPSWPYESYAWGMSIDLSTCFGCNACVVACQAENNIPVVGRDQVSRGREMHWIRIDRYYTGEGASPRVVHQPVPCMHCENAPCEVVCPVGATVHTSEGLNDMVYNRCVGTRYCSNNCPYKVRRFNFLDYRAPAGSPVYLQTNPDVTVRERGVMEKCTYCVQRINAGRIAAEKENRRIRDGEIRPACQQACPAEAIIFGDLNDPQSRVVQRKREAISYALLGELDTRPRTTYLAKIVPADVATERTIPS
ncbi:MAG TPA: 4Fe-4S dicluster domain-containing protein [Lacunisphaera sp.]|jgi:molybdopterin-containing oxidoreductase family iron-sulfur binding subunit